MDLIADNLPAYLSGFRVTLQLTAISGAIALAAGTVLAAMRVSPVATLRGIAVVWVEVLRNTPLTLVFFFLVFVAPQFGVLPPLGFWTAVLALSAYTSGFVCEAVRSGINGVPVGQAEAARAIGLTFGQTLGLVVLPQAVRSVVPPLINVLIALTKNTSVAAGFAVVELLASGRRIALANPSESIMALVSVALFYLVITIPAGYLAGILERKVAFAR
ncbi:amino acid ABC transporter permease [Cellulomonas hominis]|uniref:Amino acid ABC transporter permease n=1 Tax=Cellulomonas hominis TaxID=156981 RepID=A0A511F8F7_9CELL|nr:amino acid ABC transporter permease [Cellulomonas hominis]MBB5474381.1 glutamate transport system permease protein [Cellulomonas hominis]NKY06813.1 amino acid ABC transporter permease [Cellulomonas hominis]GEL45532.1 amino acid ABC transporter permease [Cellulomonas hominis]